MLSTLDSIEECVATLSAIEDWNSDQLDALVTLAKAVSGAKQCALKRRILHLKC